MQRAFPNGVNWLTSNFSLYLWAKVLEVQTSNDVRESDSFWKPEWSLKLFSFSSCDGKASLRIAVLLEMTPMYGGEAIWLCRAAADWETVSLISGAQTAFSASGIRRLQECLKPKHGFIWRGEQQGTFLDIQINFLARDKFLHFCFPKRIWGEALETLYFQLSWCGEESPRPKQSWQELL